MAGTVNLQTTPVGRRWPVMQAGAVAAGIALIYALVAVPRTGLHLVWDVAVPFLPLLLVAAPGVWRNACPLAVVSLLPSRTGASRRRPISRTWQSRLLVGGIALALLVIPLRLVVLDRSGPATALLLGGFALAAVGLGFVFDLKSAWCSGLCPMHPLELLYGSHPVATVKNAQCKACSGCVLPCRDSTAGASPLGAAHSPAARFAATLLVGGFPGFVLGWFLAGVRPGMTFAHTLLLAYGLPALGLAGSFALYLLVSRVHRAGAARLFAFAAVAIFYWFKLPDMLGLTAPGHAIVSLHGVIPVWSIWLLRALAVAVPAALMLRPGVIRSWSLRPMPEPRRG